MLPRSPTAATTTAAANPAPANPNPNNKKQERPSFLLFIHAKAPSGRELSPQATEGESGTCSKYKRHPLRWLPPSRLCRATSLPEGGFDYQIDILAHTTKIGVDLPV